MIIQEFLDNILVKTYSDREVYIHGGYPEADYIDPIDPISMNRTYVETNIPIVYENEPEEDDEIKELLRHGFINIPTEPESDYFNENEPEPNYFA